jgi:hypothetical protein
MRQKENGVREHMTIVGITAHVLALALLVFIPIFHVNIPVSDQWELVPYIPLVEEDLPVSPLRILEVLTHPHNEHQILFPRLIMLGLMKFSHWNIVWELWVNVILAIITFVTIYWFSSKVVKDTREADLTFSLIAVLIFSWSQWKNWLWGWQIAIFLNVATVTLGIFLLCSYETVTWKRFLGSFFLGVVAQNSFGTGLIYWPVCFLGLCLSKDRESRKGWGRQRTAGLWLLLSMAMIGLYYLRYVRPTHHEPGWMMPFEEPELYLEHLLVYLGSPMGYNDVWFSGLMGFVGLVTFAFLTVRNLQSGENPSGHEEIFRQDFKPFVLLGLYAIGSGLLISLGRADLGIAQAMSSRYITLANMLWVSNIILLLVYLDVWRWRVLQEYGAFVAILLCICLGTAYRHGIKEAHRFSVELHQVKKHVEENYWTGNIDEKVLKKLYPGDEEITKNRLRMLEKYEYNLFHEEN